MFGLPNATIMNQPLFKKKVYELFNLTTTEMKHFDEDIAKMTIVERISTATVPAIAEGEAVKGFYVLLVVLKQKQYDSRNIMKLFQLIKQRMILALQYGEEVQFVANYNKLIKSDWCVMDDAHIELVGMNMDVVWDHVIAHIGGVEVTEEQPIAEQIEQHQQCEALEAKIRAYERKRDAEHQQAKKFEWHKKVQALKKELENIKK